MVHPKSPIFVPSSPPNLDFTRRRSQSRSTSSSGGASASYRPALAGKSNTRLSSGVSVPRRESHTTGPFQHHDTTNHHNNNSNTSRISIASDSAGDVPAIKFGSFTATREELRDGSARLASLSLVTPSPLHSPSTDEPPPLNLGSSSAPEQSRRRQSADRDGKRVAHRDQATTTSSTSSSSLSNKQAGPSSPSNLSLARPTLLTGGSIEFAKSPEPINENEPITFPAPTIASSSSAQAGHGGHHSNDTGSSRKEVGTFGSSGSNGGNGAEDGITPTQSQVGSLNPQNSPGAHSGGSQGQTPTPTRMIEAQRREREKATQTRTQKSVDKDDVNVLGDDLGGNDSEEEEEQMLKSQIEVPGVEDGQPRRRRRSRPNRSGSPDGERTPLLRTKPLRQQSSFSQMSGMSEVSKRVGSAWDRTRHHLKSVDVSDVAKTSVASIPAVVLGVLMNVLDGVSYGLISFPTNLPVFADFGGIGVSMFFVTCVVSQIVYTGGGSIFKGGNGSMMIEVVPFFHSIAGIIAGSVSDDRSVVATTMVAFAMSSVLTGIAFGVLGVLRLGSLCEFFPRHILVGCIGGVGAFLFVTGLQVSARLEDEASLSLDLIKHYLQPSVLPLWTIPLALAIILRLITARFHHPLVFPGFFIAIPVVFYAIAAAARIDIETLRQHGWVFEVNGVDSTWYEYWTLFDFSKTHWSAVLDTIPTQLALVFFGLLHVPINVPALAISVGEDNVNTNRELVAHGVSNVAAGLIGSVPNYLCYVNSVLFYRVGGTTRVSGFLLAAANFGVLVAGPGIISYLPVCVVGALIYILAIDLVKEAVWDTYGRVARFEYITICAIVLVMTAWDFVVGIGVGIILACVSFVVISSQRRAIRSILSGSVARSTVRRHPKQSAFLQDVGSQTRIMKLQGFLFFGTISAVESTIRKILEAASWSQNPIRFLVLDFSMASGVDFSAAEAFVRIQRLLDDKDAVLVLCGCPANSNVGIALRSVDLWADDGESKVEVFENLNDALEHCENAFLRSLYSQNFQPPRIAPTTPALTSQIDVPKDELDSEIVSFAQSPRSSHLRTAAKETMTRTETTPYKTNFQQPLPILMQSLRPFESDLNEDYCFRLVPYFKRVNIERGTTLWNAGDEGDSCYVIESGMLRATYVFKDRSHAIAESMVAGTVAGEMSFLSRSKRNATVVAERDSVLWKLTSQGHDDMGKKEGWTFARKFEQCLTRIACEEQDVLQAIEHR
ncbi:hypothetical protein OIO90_000773 [Microbotryomycetes sp. JL221]|nr:hypothetical protein OIO90_000773 [Microbotryomycetes sp. JL221]